MPGDDDWGEPEHTDVLKPGEAPGMVESLDELKLRTAREGGTVYVRDEGAFYTFTSGVWVVEDDE